MKSIVIFYSKNGSNRFLANKIADILKTDIEEIKPRINARALLIFGITIGNKKIKTDLAQYDKIFLVGPVWMGKFIAPLKSFVKKYKNKFKKVVFVTCCGSDFKIKDEKFGHGNVFKYINNILGEKCIHCEAFPISLILPEDKKQDPEATMNTQLNNSNFNGEIKNIFDNFIEKIK